MSEHGAPPTKPSVQEKVQEMAALRQGGLSLEAIGKQFGISAPTVTKYLRQAGINTGRRAALNPRQRDHVVRRYRGGESMGGLAEAFGVSSPTIRRALREAGEEVRSISEASKGRQAHNKKQFSSLELAAIRRMWEVERLTAEEIAGRLELGSYGPVFRVIRELVLSVN